MINKFRENYHLLLPNKKNKTAGVPDRAEKIIKVDVMRAAERVFWARRGYSEPPGVNLSFPKRQKECAS